MTLVELYQAVSAVCPIDSVRSDKTIQFSAAATPLQRAAAQTIANAFDFNAPSTAPDVANFLVDLYGTVFGGSFATVDTVLKASPSFAQLQTQLETGNWTAAAGIILYAQSISAISGPQYAAIKTAAAARHIPVTLP